jgi:hypothetical protein
MRYLKMLALVAMATAGLMAFVGASSASAGVLCKTETDPCNNRVKKNETVSSQTQTGKAAFINTGLKNIECEKSTLAGEVTKEGGKGEVPEVAVQTLSFTNCKCEVMVLKKGTYYMSHIAGTFDGRPFGTGQEIATQCVILGVQVKCVYSTNNTLLGELQKGNPAVIELNAKLQLVPASSEPGCEETATWTGFYEVTTPKPLYVASE